MLHHLKYLRYVLAHKWYVFLEACKLGIPWRGIIHDISKFRPSEWFAYARYFYDNKGRLRKVRDKYGYYKPTDTGDKAFDFAWLLHQKRNDHHWQWFVLPEDEGGLKILEMSSVARREMLADWRGAGKAQGKSSVGLWYETHKNKMSFGPETRKWVEEQLEGEINAE